MPTTCFDGIVGIHHRVNKEIHSTKPDSSGNRESITVPAVDEDREVMIIVEKREFCFPENDKYCIKKFWKLRKGEQKRPQAHLGGAHHVRGVAHRILEAT